MACENIWFDRLRVEAAEASYYEKKYSGVVASSSASSALISDIQNIKDHIRSALAGDSSASAVSEIDMQKLNKLEDENKALRRMIDSLEARVAALEMSGGAKPAAAAAPKESAPAQSKPDDDDDDDVDLFGSDDEEDEEAEKIRQERLAAYHAKKSKKPAVIAKSSITIDVKPWDDETDLKEMEAKVRAITMDGLVWGTGKLVPVGYGINKLQIVCVVEDDKVSTDDLEDHIMAFEDHVQSMDIAAFNKI